MRLKDEARCTRDESRAFFYANWAAGFRFRPSIAAAFSYVE